MYRVDMTATGELLRPDNGPADSPAATSTTTDTGWWDRLAGWTEVVPAQVWVALLLLFTVAAIITLPIARKHAYKAGRRAAGHTSDTDRRDQALFLAAMIPAAFFLLAVLAGSFRGLVSFGVDTLRWTNGWEYLVPLTLDGVAISFGFLAFRAVRKMRSPERAYRVVWGATAASALINYIHEATVPGGSWLGGGYLAILSLFGMLIFHEFLEQFVEGAAYIQRVNPKFGLRWVTWPSNTACAWTAWRNYPPTPLRADATADERSYWGSVAHAIKHLNEVRAMKRSNRIARDLEDATLSAPWWTALAPWVRLRQLGTALAEHKATVAARDAEHAEMSARFDRIAAEYAEQRITAERMAEQVAQERAERDAAEQRAKAAERDAERARNEAAERTAQLRAEAAEREQRLRLEHAEQLAGLRSDNSGSAGRSPRSKVVPINRSKSGAKTDNPMATDDGALAAMFAEHPERDFNWTDREAHRITRAGFSSRAPRLVNLATEHQRTCTSEQHSTCFGADRATDDKEDSPRAYASATA